MNYKNIPQENKAEILESAVINGSSEEIVKTFKELGYIEMTARALGLACRFRGLDIVKTLTERGAAFDIPMNEEAERLYHCYSGRKWRCYRTNFALYLLNISKQIKGACCCKGLKLTKRIARRDGTFLPQLPDSERAEVLKYLCENAGKLSFEPEELLYCAIFAQDVFIASELKKLGVKLSEKRVSIMTNGGPISDGYWYEWCSMQGKLANDDYLPVMRTIAAELGGERFHCTEKVYDLTKTRFENTEILEFFRDNFKIARLNKTQIIRDIIDVNNPGAFPVFEKLGWLSEPRRRDEMIDYAQKLNRTECVAWLLDFKNRTADLAAEREKAEKKMMAELNASPTSVAVMKKTWGYKKQEDGTLIITSYKGTSTDVRVPERIGKSTVTAIGEGAFSGNSGMCAGRVTAYYATYDQQRHRRTITKITLPESVNSIGNSAFAVMEALTEINIPVGVTQIGAVAFYQCLSLETLVIPSSVKRIGVYAFRNCGKLTAIVERGSFAEEYCKENGVKFRYKEQ